MISIAATTAASDASCKPANTNVPIGIVASAATAAMTRLSGDPIPRQR